MSNFIDLTGNVFGRLTVIERAENRGKRIFWLVRCICGLEKEADGSHLRSGSSTSCGCSRIKDEGWLTTAKKAYKPYRDGDITLDKFIELSQDNCYYCGCEPATKANAAKWNGSKISKHRQEQCYWTYNGLDRVVNEKGHYLDNVVTCCRWCNQMKLQHSQQDFYDKITAIYKKAVK